MPFSLLLLLLIFFLLYSTPSLFVAALTFLDHETSMVFLPLLLPHLMCCCERQAGRRQLWWRWRQICNTWLQVESWHVADGDGGSQICGNVRTTDACCLLGDEVAA
ncbi:hypothetical protein VPH35_083507 [Triticum aestivum]